MASNFSKIVRIAVKNGDAIPENRLKGKSNTGTYFLCSSNQYDEFKEFIDDELVCFIDHDRVKMYYYAFMQTFYLSKDQYVDKMYNFEQYCHSLYSSNIRHKIYLRYRINDSRYFIRFKENDNIYVNAFRHILYGDISYLVLEKRDNKYFIYPELVYLSHPEKEEESDIIYID